MERSIETLVRELSAMPLSPQSERQLARDLRNRVEIGLTFARALAVDFRTIARLVRVERDEKKNGRRDGGEPVSLAIAGTLRRSVAILADVLGPQPQPKNSRRGGAR